MFAQLTALLDAEGAEFRVLAHAAEGNSVRVAQIRNTETGQGAKAMICRMRGADFKVMAVVPSDRRVNLVRVAEHFGYKKSSFLPADEAMALTGCPIGAIPPFSFSENLRLVMDPELAERYTELAFNAGALNNSIILSTRDYLRNTP